MWLGIFKPNLVCKFFTKDHTCRFENNPFLYSWMFFFLFRDLGLLSNRTGISAFEIWERLVAGIEAIKVVIQIEQKEQVWTQSYECVGVCVCVHDTKTRIHNSCVPETDRMRLINSLIIQELKTPQSQNMWMWILERCSAQRLKNVSSCEEGLKKLF